MLIDQLPLIVKEAAGGLAGANVNVLNGADGLGEIAAGLVAQGLTILDSVRQNLNGRNHGRPQVRGSFEKRKDCWSSRATGRPGTAGRDGNEPEGGPSSTRVPDPKFPYHNGAGARFGDGRVTE